MYLDVNWKDGTVTHVPLAQSHTIQVVADGKIQDSFSFDGVASLTLNLDGAPAATDPNPAPNVGAAEGPTVTPEQQAALDAEAEAQRQAAADAEAQAAADQAAAEQAQIDAAAAAVPAPVAPETPGTPDGLPTPHDDAVDAATTSVAAAQNIVAAPDVAPADKQVQIQTALADVEASLAEFPDSPKLLDAKVQLEALAGEISQA